MIVGEEVWGIRDKNLKLFIVKRMAVAKGNDRAGLIKVICSGIFC